LRPDEIVVVDGAPQKERATEEMVAAHATNLPFQCRYLRSARGTAVQRNVGIDAARGEFIALIDDDVRLEPDFLERIAAVFDADADRRVGGVVGYRSNQHIRDASRWRWYRRLRLFTTYEPGRYDFQNGYPINTSLQPPFTGTREVDFMTTACAVWRREVFDSGLRFDLFFHDYGMLEDANLSLRAGRQWKLLQCGDAHCIELNAPGGRPDRRKLGYKCVVNYYYVFCDVAHPLSWQQQVRFWRFQFFELLRVSVSFVRRGRLSDLHELHGRIEGMLGVAGGICAPAKSRDDRPDRPVVQRFPLLCPLHEGTFKEEAMRAVDGLMRGIGL
jgi:glycosyltransferase involved in cell wall biosynthesis